MCCVHEYTCFNSIARNFTVSLHPAASIPHASCNRIYSNWVFSTFDIFIPENRYRRSLPTIININQINWDPYNPQSRYTQSQCFHHIHEQLMIAIFHLNEDFCVWERRWKRNSMNNSAKSWMKQWEFMWNIARESTLTNLKRKPLSNIVSVQWERSLASIILC